MSDNNKKIYWGCKTVPQNSDTYWNKYPLKPGEETHDRKGSSFYGHGSDEERRHSKRSRYSDEDRQKRKKRKHSSDEPKHKRSHRHDDSHEDDKPRKRKDDSRDGSYESDVKSRKKKDDSHEDDKLRKRRDDSCDGSYESDVKSRRRKDDSYEDDKPRKRRDNSLDGSYESDFKSRKKKDSRHDDSHDRLKKKKDDIYDNSYENDKLKKKRDDVYDDSYENDKMRKKKDDTFDDSYESDKGKKRRDDAYDDSYENERVRKKRDDIYGSDDENDKPRKKKDSDKEKKGHKEKRDHKNKDTQKEKEKISPSRKSRKSPSFKGKEKGKNKENEEKEKKKDATTAKDVITADQKKTVDLLTSRTGGAYIPPAKLKMMQASITDKASAAYQRIAWEALKKSLHGLINKASPQNICIIAREILRENVIRGRGLLCRSILQAQAASPTFTNVFAALVAIVNSKFPNIGELLLKRCIIRFKQGFRRNDKPTCLASAIFIAHMVNQCIAHEIVALELLTLLLETPTNDSVEVAIAFLKECGQKLAVVCKKGLDDIFDLLRNILHEGSLEKRVQYMIEVMFQVRKDGFKDHPTVPEELDLVEEEDQFTHVISLTEDKLESQDILNVFKFDPEYEENEQKYENLKKELFGSDDESEEGSGSDEESGSDDSDDSDAAEEKKQTIIDNTETNLVALRRTIYLTINSSLDFEECAHKLLKMELKPGQEIEMCNMFLDCCAEQRTYEKFYGLLAQRFCQINQIYIAPFEKIFVDSYAIVHRFTTNKLRNVAKFFAHLLHTDAISWNVLSTIHLNEEETSSSSRIFIKILFQELSEFMGLAKLNERIKDLTMHMAFEGLFPRDNPKNTRFAINFFTSIGLGGLTNELREHLKTQPKQSNVNKIMEALSDSSSSSSSSSDSDSDSSSSSSSSD